MGERSRPASSDASHGQPDGPSDDLSAEALEAFLPGRPLRTYPALVATGITALGWANSGAPDGAVVVAGYQVSPRGRAGRPWSVVPGQGLGLSLVMRPRLRAGREGWLYTVVLAALADVYGDRATIAWPDEVRCEGEVTAAVGIQSRLAGKRVKWAIVDLVAPHARAPRGELLGSVLRAVEARRASADSVVREDYDRRCETIGQRVRARLLGGTGPRIEGTAVATLDDGALLLETTKGARAPVRPQDVRDVETH